MSDFSNLTGKTGQYTILQQRDSDMFRVVFTNRIHFDAKKGIWADHPIKDRYYELPPGIKDAKDLPSYVEFEHAFHVLSVLNGDLK